MPSEASGCKPLDYAAQRASELEAWLPHLYGNRFASVLALKGESGPSEQSGNPPFFGMDGEALENALATLGWGSNAWCGIALELPEKGIIGSSELRMLVEIIDPRALLALDRQAIDALQLSFGIELLPSIPIPGQITWLLGRALVYVEGFEAALISGEEEAKRRVWRELRTLKPSMSY